MIVRSTLFRCAMLAFPAVLSAIADRAAGQCRYEVTVIPPPVNPKIASAGPVAINDLGQVAGAYSISIGPIFPMLWSPPTGHFLPAFPAFVSEATPHDISNTPTATQWGLVVGSYGTFTSSSRPFSHDGVLLRDLGALGGTTNGAAAFAVNSQNHVVGASQPPEGGTFHAVMWRDGQIIDIGADLPEFYSSASDVNDAGMVVGTMHTGPGFPAERGFAWANGAPINLPPTPAGEVDFALCVNNKESIVVMVLEPDRSSPNKYAVTHDAYLYSAGQYHHLGILGRFDGFNLNETFPADINDADVIVGLARDSDDNAVTAFIWQNGVLRNLQDLIDPAAAPGFLFVALNFAHSINSSGQIVCDAIAFTSEHSFSVIALLTPVPATPGDTNCDSQVNIDDLTDVILNWNNVGGAADLNFDQSVNVLDLAQVVENWSVTK